MDAHQVVAEVLVQFGELQHHVCIAPLELHRDRLLVWPLQHSETLLVATSPSSNLSSFFLSFWCSLFTLCGEFGLPYLGKALAAAASSSVLVT